jgi:hypothetical protein
MTKHQNFWKRSLEGLAIDGSVTRAASEFARSAMA